MQKALTVLRGGGSLSVEQSRGAFDQIMSGRVSDDDLGAFLVLLADKGETEDEVIGAATVMREKATRVRCDDPDAIDTCGTGGDGTSTFNVSTAAGLVAAAAGARVAKHGNRTNTRVSGSAEAMIALGINVDADVATLEKCLDEAGFAFLYAVNLHPAMKYAVPVRKKLGRRTIFNLLGPLCNPAGVRRQLLGVNQPELTGKIAAALLGLDAARAMVVHGDGGLCDLTTTGVSKVTELRDGKLEELAVDPAELGLARAELSDLLVDSPAASARAIRDVLAGKPGPRRDVAVLNAAAALVVAGKAADLSEGVALAAEAVDTGRANDLLGKVVSITGG